jgi:hypothetical protein
MPVTINEVELLDSVPENPAPTNATPAPTAADPSHAFGDLLRASAVRRDRLRAD